MLLCFDYLVSPADKKDDLNKGFGNWCTIYCGRKNLFIMSQPRLEHQESRKRLDKGVGDADRRSRFKERSRNLERGVSAPALFSTDSKTKPKTKAPLPLTEEETLTIGHGMGHEFARKTYFQPTYCHHCTELLWGLKGQGFQCKGA